MLDIPTELRRLRKLRRYSITEAAQIIGISRPTLMDAERGRFNPATLRDKMVGLYDAYGRDGVEVAIAAIEIHKSIYDRRVMAAARIQELRIKMRLPYAKLARLLGFGPDRLRQWISGRDLPSIEAINQINERLNCFGPQRQEYI